MITRREFLKSAALFGTAILIPNRLGGWSRIRQVIQPTLDPTTIHPYQSALFVPPAMPKVGEIIGKGGETIDSYEITLRQFQQQVLPAGMPPTTVWSYGTAQNPGSFTYPGWTIEAQVNRPVRVKWINGLMDQKGRYLPHLFQVDPTLHWANPPGPVDEIPIFSQTPDGYSGPVPMVTHLHGAHSYEEGDGYPEAWYLPDAVDLPTGYSKVGSHYSQFAAKYADTYGETWSPGSAIFQYPNDQRATTLWYHDHTLGLTRLAVYAGSAGFYLLRGGAGDLSAGILPDGVYEVPLLIQDRSFNADGSLFYPSSREFFDGFTGPFVPDSDMAPFWNPETFGNTLVVNGQTWPYLAVQPRRYRMRILNGCNARTLMLKLVSDPKAPRPASAALPLWQIGVEGGYLKAPVQRDQILLGPAERADVIIDFTGLPQGMNIYLINEGPDEPFGGGVPETDFPAADVNTTGQVMRFDVVAASGTDTSLPPDQLNLPDLPTLPAAGSTRMVSMNELDSDVLTGVGPRIGLLGTVNSDGSGAPLRWMDTPSEVVKLGSTEVWEVHNYTEDAHPVHLHLVQFRLVNRESMDTHAVRPPEAWENGFKDTILAYPGEITRLQATYDRAGQYVWHCHILEHEDNEMMRPMQVVTAGSTPGDSSVFLPIINR